LDCAEAPSNHPRSTNRRAAFGMFCQPRHEGGRSKQDRRHATRNVVLTGTHEQIIQALVASGGCRNASAVMREGLRLLEQREGERAAKFAALRAAAALGFGAIEEGRFQDIDEGDLAERIAALGRRAAKAASKTGSWPWRPSGFRLSRKSLHDAMDLPRRVPPTCGDGA
jgi:antitoxin ParD1/3/4